MDARPDPGVGVQPDSIQAEPSLATENGGRENRSSENPTSVSPAVQPDNATMLAAKWLLCGKLLKTKRYSHLSFKESDLVAIAHEAVVNSAPSSQAVVVYELTERLKRGLDDRAAALAIAQRPIRHGLSTVQKLPPRKDRKALRYDYKPNKQRKPILFGTLQFDDTEYSNVEDYVGHEVYRLEQKQGSESEHARINREEQEAKIKRLAETTKFASVLGRGAQSFDTCHKPIPTDKKRIVILHAEIPNEDADVGEIQTRAVVCGECPGAVADLAPRRMVDASDDSTPV